MEQSVVEVLRGFSFYLATMNKRWRTNPDVMLEDLRVVWRWASSQPMFRCGVGMTNQSIEAETPTSVGGQTFWHKYRVEHSPNPQPRCQGENKSRLTDDYKLRTLLLPRAHRLSAYPGCQCITGNPVRLQTPKWQTILLESSEERVMALFITSSTMVLHIFQVVD